MSTQPELLREAVETLRRIADWPPERLSAETDEKMRTVARACVAKIDAALSSVVIPAGCVCTTKANDMAALIESAICDAELERIIEESDARWTEDMFHVHGGELMNMLRKAAASGRQDGAR